MRNYLYMVVLGIPSERVNKWLAVVWDLQFLCNKTTFAINRIRLCLYNIQ